MLVLSVPTRLAAVSEPRQVVDLSVERQFVTHCPACELFQDVIRDNCQR